jgi:hypothetical protein
VAARQPDRAVTLLLRCAQQAAALELVLGTDVQLSEELVDALTPDKTPDNAETRTAALLGLAQV